MGNLKAEMFNRKASDPRNCPDRIVEALQLAPGQKVADIGSGGGYFTVRFAKEVGSEGRVYAVDTDEKLLRSVREKVQQEGLGNVEAVHATGERPTLPEAGLDLIFARNVFHHLSDRVSYFADLKTSLTPNGKVAIIEYKPGSIFSFRRLFGHYVVLETIAEEMRRAGYEMDETFDFLPEQSFSLFSPIK